MRLLVTGCSGYIAGRLVPCLKARGHIVAGLDRRRPETVDLDRFVHGDLLDLRSLSDALDGVEAVLHLAAAKGDFGIADREYVRDNLDATRVLITAGRKAGVRRWLFFSSVAAMGSSASYASEQAPLNPANAYGTSKAEAERLFHRLVEDDPMAEVAILRPSAVYGPGDWTDTNVYRLIDAIHRNRFVMIGTGETMKTLSYIDNVVAATLFLMDATKPGVQTYIYVDEPVMSTAELVRRIYEVLGQHGPRWHVPAGLAVGLASAADVLGRLTGVDFPITAARIKKFSTATTFDGGAIRRLGFRQPVDNDAALRATVAWYLSGAA
jgi:nucleoside-diphosphate-sugar epimerase